MTERTWKILKLDWKTPGFFLFTRKETLLEKNCTIINNSDGRCVLIVYHLASSWNSPKLCENVLWLNYVLTALCRKWMYCLCQACAHRFRRSSVRRSYRWGLGYCVTLTNALEEEMPLQPCEGLDMNTPDGTFAYGFCQAGTSAAVSKVTLLLSLFVNFSLSVNSSSNLWGWMVIQVAKFSRCRKSLLDWIMFDFQCASVSK